MGVLVGVSRAGGLFWCVDVWLRPARMLTIHGYFGVCCAWLVAWCAIPLVVARDATGLACFVLVTHQCLQTCSIFRLCHNVHCHIHLYTYSDATFIIFSILSDEESVDIWTR